ncbi:MAG: ribonuclease G [Pseudomonadota bacterium]
MGEELLVNVTPVETRVAVLEQGMLQDLHIERSAHRGIVGNIYLGRVVRVLPGMQAAFVDIGAERTGFLHVSDIHPRDHDGWERRELQSNDIGEQLYEGQSLLVQVSKEPLGSKGARLTTQLSMSSRYLVYMPRTPHIGISQQIENDDERSRLRGVLDQVCSEMDMAGGFILRTAAEGAGRDELRGDLRFLQRLWTAVQQRVENSAPVCVYEDWQLYHRSIRDLARPGLERIRVDSRETFEKLGEFCHHYIPELAGLLEHYAEERPLFEVLGVEDEIARALERKVPLPSGGYLVIDETEAMTTVDVNTGGFVGRNDQEETVFRTNLEAAEAAARQVRLRNLGGIIIIDFIDMQDVEHQRQVIGSLEKAMSRDPARNTISAVSSLGLVEMTRKRTRESLAQSLCEECPTCAGAGSVKSTQTLCYEILREILRKAGTYAGDILMVQASQEVVDHLLAEDAQAVADLEIFAGKTLHFQVEPEYSRERFDIILL